MIKIERKNRNLTQLEHQLREKVLFIQKYSIEPKYTPMRVEPGKRSNIDHMDNWSKYLGETLFINRALLNRNELKEALFWREAFLLFISKELRNSWWANLLANAFPFSVKLNTTKLNKWKEFISKQVEKYRELFDLLMQIIASSGIEGMIRCLHDTLYYIYSKTTNTIKTINHTKVKLDKKELNILLSNIYFDLVSITETAVDIMEKALIKQTIRPNILSKYTNSHVTTISKITKKLCEMGVIDYRYLLNYSAIGLTQYIVLLICTKKQKAYFEKPPPNPFLLSHKYNCLNSCIITQLYIGPKNKEFYQKLNDYCKDLINENKIFDYYTFEILSSYRSYTFKYFDSKTKTQNINFNDISINSGLFNTEKNIQTTNGFSDNILIPSRVMGSKMCEVDKIDLKIIEQFLLGNTKRRVIQKNIKKDMNETVKRINRLIDDGILFESVIVILPNSVSDTTIYIQNESNNKQANSSYRPLQDRIKDFSYHIPNVYIGEIKGSFDGVVMRTFLPQSSALQLADLLTWYLPDDINYQMLLGKSEYQKFRFNVNIKRWRKGKYYFTDEDFKI